MTKKSSLSLLCILSLCFLPTVGHAKRAGFSGLHALADSADTVFWNPAGMTRLPQTLQVQTAIGFSNADFKVEESSIEGGDPTSQNDILIIPGIYYVHPLTEEWYAGISLNVPSGVGTDYGNSWAGRYHAEETSLVFLSLSPSAAYKVNDELSVSAGLNIMYVDSLSKSRVNNLFDSDDGRFELEEDGIGVGYVLGMLYESTESTRLGLTYHSKVDIDLGGIPEFGNLDDALVLALNNDGLLGGQVNVDFETPQMVGVGLFHQLNDKYSVTADAMWIDMSEFGVEHVSQNDEGLTVPSMFQDIYVSSVGMGYKWDDKTNISVGASYVTTPVKDTEDRSLFLALDRIVVVGFGVERTLQNGHVLDIKLDIADLGDANIDLQGSAIQGDLKGQFDNHYAVLIDINYHYNF